MKTLIIFLLISTDLFSNNFNIVERDTIFIIFNQNQKAVKSSFDMNNSNTNDFDKNSKIYTILKDSNNYISFVYRKYKDFDLNPAKVEIKKKKFLKNKNVFCSDSIGNGNLSDLFFFLNTRVVFIIDKDEMRYNKIVIREISSIISPYYYVE